MWDCCIVSDLTSAVHCSTTWSGRLDAFGGGYVNDVVIVLMKCSEIGTGIYHHFDLVVLRYLGGGKAHFVN